VRRDAALTALAERSGVEQPALAANAPRPLTDAALEQLEFNTFVLEYLQSLAPQPARATKSSEAKQTSPSSR
jgi:hypothetical protein